MSLYSKSVTITTTDPTKIFTVPKGFKAHLSYIFLENHSANNVDMDLFIREHHGDETHTDIYLMDSTELKEAEPKEFYNGVFVMHEGDFLQAQLDVAQDNVVIVATFELMEETAFLAGFGHG